VCNNLTDSALPRNHELKIGLCNARSILNKWDDIIDHIIEHTLDILLVTETWIPAGGADPPQLSHLPAGYSIFHIPRSHRRGGGVAIIYRECLHVKSLSKIQATSFEGLEAVISVNSSCIRVVAIYRPPPSKKNGFTTKQFLTEFSDFLESETTSSGKLLIAGDFNFHWNNLDNNDTIQIREVVDSAALVQSVSGPTHTSGHTLDWVLTREAEHIILKTEISSLISDHHMIHCYLHLKKPPLPREERFYRRYKSINIAHFQEDIEDSALVKEPADTLNVRLDQYNQTLSALIEKHAPLKRGIVTVRPVVPWYDEDIHRAKLERRKCELTWRRSHLTVHREIYQQSRNKVSALITKAKTSYFSNKVNECGTDQRAMFKVVDCILGRNNKLALPPHASLNDLLETFSTFFHSKISAIRQRLDAEPNDSLMNPSSVLPIEDPEPCGSLRLFNTITEEDILKIITATPSKSCQLDPIPTWLLKKVITPLVPAITDVVNMSIQSNSVPLLLKKALVTPVIKKPSLDKGTLKNYHPVSNLPFISKILEKAVLAQVTDHMVLHDLYCPVQSAYRPLHSTETALLKIVNDIFLALDSGKSVILCLLDLSAAFDTIDHGILVSRLQSRIGIEATALQWFESYLDNRYQSVSIKGESSSPVLLRCGVPQGSVFGPNEFINYMAPTYDIALQHGISMHQYADDTQLYFAFNPSEQKEAVAKVEACVDDIKRWMTDNKLQLNEDKSELVIISPVRQANKVNIDSIKVGECVVKAAPTAKNLGATFDATMTQSKHVTELVKSCNFHLRSIGQARRFLTQDATTKVIHAFISSRLDYCNSLLYGLPDYQIARLQRVQNTAARIVTKTRKFDHISPVLESLHWLPVGKRIDFKILCLTYKCIHGLAPKYLADLINSYQPVRPLRSSEQLLLTEPKTRLKSYGDRSFSKAAPKLWNSLPLALRASNSLDLFKENLKTYLF
jgi:hypothetical protein